MVVVVVCALTKELCHLARVLPLWLLFVVAVVVVVVVVVVGVVVLALRR